MTVPTEPAEQHPHAAVIELIDQHRGEKRRYTGAGSILVPNLLRIDGITMWATTDQPVTVQEVLVDGQGRAPFAVTVQLLARALRFGDAPSVVMEPGGPGRPAGAVVEIPDVDILEARTELERPYVLLNGRRLYVQGPIRVGGFTTGGGHRDVVRVELTLLCRRFTADDEPIAES